ncbi:MAG: hypothetical protein V7644_2623 [Actinomycetota bacterium]
MLLHDTATGEEARASLAALAASGADIAAVGFDDQELERAFVSAGAGKPSLLEPAAVPGRGLGLVLASLRTTPPADLLVLRACTRPAPDVYGALRDVLYADSLGATAAAVPAPEVADPSGPAWGCVLVRREALQLATATVDTRPLAQAPLLDVLDLLLRQPGFVHRRAVSALAATPATAWAPPPARAGGDILRVLVDGRCWAHPVSGTQLQVLQLVRALARLEGVELGVLLPTAVHPSGAPGVAQLPAAVARHVSPGLPERRPHVFHRPFQLLFEHEIGEVTGFAERLVVTQQDMILGRTRAYFASEREWRRFGAMTHLSFLAADHVAFFSESARLDALDDGVLDPAKTSVVPLGTDHLEEAVRLDPAAARPPRGLEDAVPFLLVLGNDYLHKNRLYAIRLLESLAAEHGWRGRLVLAGEHAGFGGSAPLERAYLAGHPETARRVVDVARVDEAERRWLYRNSTLVLYPTLYEGFGLVPFEAAAFGTASVYSSRSALGEFLPAEGALLEGWEPAADAARIARVLGEEGAVDRIVEAVRAAGRPLTWERTARAYLDVYRSARAAPVGFSLLAGDDFALGARELVARTPAEGRLLKAYRLSPLARAGVDAALGAAAVSRRWMRSRGGGRA